LPQFYCLDIAYSFISTALNKHISYVPFKNKYACVCVCYRLWPILAEMLPILPHSVVKVIWAARKTSLLQKNMCIYIPN